MIHLSVWQFNTSDVKSLYAASYIIEYLVNE